MKAGSSRAAASPHDNLVRITKPLTRGTDLTPLYMNQAVGLTQQVSVVTNTVRE